MAGSCVFSCSLSFDRGRDHILQYDLERHAVTAPLVSKEELAIALEFAIGKCNSVTVIIPMESKIELVEAETPGLFGIALGLLDFAYHPIVHAQSPFVCEKKKARALAHAFDALVKLLAVSYYSHSGVTSIQSIARFAGGVNQNGGLLTIAYGKCRQIHM
jgi:hypothetical protein